MNLSKLDTTTYKNLLVTWLKQYEGQEAKIYSDDKGYPTIGIKFIHIYI